MVSRILLKIVLPLLTSTAFCQTRKVHLGLEIMPSLATQILPSPEQKNPLRFSLSGGLIIFKEFPGTNIYLKSGLQLSNRGYGYTVKVENPQGQVFGKFRYTEHLNYLSIPINLGLTFNDIYFEFGPQVEYFLFRRQKHDAAVEDKTPPQNINKFNFGGNISAGTVIYPNSRRKTYGVRLGGYISITSNPVFFNAGVKMGLTKRLK